jgi:hypothetical protein
MKQQRYLKPEQNSYTRSVIMYEIIANPEDYQIDHLINGTGNANIDLTQDERNKWAGEIVNFSEKLTEFAKKSEELARLLSSDEKISATPASLKTLKIQLFAINDALNSALTIADKLESDIVQK